MANTETGDEERDDEGGDEGDMNSELYQGTKHADFRRKLRALMDIAGHNEVSMAKALGITQGTLNAYFIGRERKSQGNGRKPVGPSAFVLKKMFERLDFPIDYLMDDLWQEEPSPELVSSTLYIMRQIRNRGSVAAARIFKNGLAVENNHGMGPKPVLRPESSGGVHGRDQPKQEENGIAPPPAKSKRGRPRKSG